MKTCYELDENDIKKLLAEHFGTKETEVDININAVTKGYGYDEHIEHEISATVRLS